VAFANAGGTQQLVAAGRADEEAGKVVRAWRVHPRHLRSLAPEQRRAAPGAGIGHRADDAREYARIDLRGREIVEKEKRLGAHRERVVHAVVDQVRADDLVAVEKARELELGADAVRRRDEHAVGAGRREEPAELADLLDVKARRDELVSPRHVDAEEALMAERRRADPHVHLACAVTSEELDDRSAGGAAHDGVVDDDDAPPVEHIAQSVVLERDTLTPELGRWLDERSADVAVLDEPFAERDTAA